MGESTGIAAGAAANIAGPGGGAGRAVRGPTVRRLARAGLAARGLVYAVIGVLAVELALGQGGGADNQTGALRTIARQPFGKVLLVLVAIGLAGYAAWRLLRAAAGHGAEQRDDRGDRIAALASGIAYVVLCVTAVKILLGAGAGSGTPKHAAAGVLGWPAGPVLVAIAGVVLIGVGGYQAHKGITRSFLEDSRTGEMTPAVTKAFTIVGVVGHLARAVVFALIGYGLVTTAIAYDPHKAVGLDGALRELAHATYGRVLLAIVAAGLIAFASYSFADARYRRL